MDKYATKLVDILKQEHDAVFARFVSFLKEKDIQITDEMMEEFAQKEQTTAPIEPKKKKGGRAQKKEVEKPNGGDLLHKEEFVC